VAIWKWIQKFGQKLTEAGSLLVSCYNNA